MAAPRVPAPDDVSVLLRAQQAFGIKDRLWVKHGCANFALGKRFRTKGTRFIALRRNAGPGRHLPLRHTSPVFTLHQGQYAMMNGPPYLIILLVGKVNKVLC